ncbi:MULTISPECIES: alpha/beta fold hydrolase [unclassified Lysinibacillus]|uniref:alpha/beta fold hydrolase n=1 Tax=unclassified Lysinibacillus TaxID=2636778 RepID=UPI001F0D7075|nr:MULTISPECIES: alpha/beta hydrolase [unclassified Lysinibacillus]
MQENIMTLSDGRKLGFSVYGDKKGLPLFLFHGTPGSRIWFLEDDKIAHRLGFYLIATDRPGYGLSDKKVNREIIEYSSDIEELADYLQLDEFSVLGVSGGGAYATAVSHCLPDKVKLCILVSTATPFVDGKPSKAMSKENRLAFFLTNYFPWLLRLANNSQKKMIDKNPEKYKATLKKGGSHLSEWDNKMLLDEEVLENGVIHSKEAYRQGVDEVIYESKLLTKDWGFKLEEIKTPIKIWHGEDDTLSPINEVKVMAKKLLNTESHYIENGGHFLTENDELWESILTNIMEYFNQVVPIK